MPEIPEITRTTRDPEAIRAALETWIDTHVPGARIPHLETPGNGMSSETVLFELRLPDDRTEELVVRLAAPDDAVPVFPRYDLESQARVMELVGRRTAAPVPRVLFVENDPGALGAPFIVMERGRGRVPPDAMPYTIEGFMLSESPEDLRRMQDASVDVLAEVHRVPLGPETAFLEYDEPGSTALRRHLSHWKSYADWVAHGRPIPILDEALAWLEGNWPVEADERSPALSWGDARIGNILYDDHRPVAVLDWEMAGIAPVEVDLGWMSFLHTFFQDLTVDLGLRGLPGFMDAGDVAARYERTTGTAVADMHWFCTYAAYRHAAIMVRVTDRLAHFGDAPPGEDCESAILHRARLREMISV